MGLRTVRNRLLRLLSKPLKITKSQLRASASLNIRPTYSETQLVSLLNLALKSTVFLATSDNAASSKTS